MENSTRDCTVTMLWNKSIQKFSIRRGFGIQALCVREKTPLEFDCRKADCGICVFRTLDGAANLSEMTAREKDFLTAMQADDDERLACQCRVLGDVAIRVEY